MAGRLATGKVAVINRGIFSHARKESLAALRFAESFALARKAGRNRLDTISLGKLANTVGGEKGRVAWIALLEFALQTLKTYGIAFGPWNDQTGNLRRSYVTLVIERSPKMNGGPLGIFANVAKYAEKVEARPKKWVVSGSVKANQKFLNAFIGGGLKFSEMKKRGA